jgi:hypothetical protein
MPMKALLARIREEDKVSYFIRTTPVTGSDYLPQKKVASVSQRIEQDPEEEYQATEEDGYNSNDSTANDVKEDLSTDGEVDEEGFRLLTDNLISKRNRDLRRFNDISHRVYADHKHEKDLNDDELTDLIDENDNGGYFALVPDDAGPIREAADSSKWEDDDLTYTPRDPVPEPPKKVSRGGWNKMKYLDKHKSKSKTRGGYTLRGLAEVEAKDAEMEKAVLVKAHRKRRHEAASDQ